MPKSVWLLTALAGAGCAQRVHETVPAESRPVIIKRWAGDYFASPPVNAEFVLYENDWAIYSRWMDGDRWASYFAARLTPRELDELHDRVRPDDLADLPGFQDLAETTSDLGTRQLCFQPPWMSPARWIGVRGFILASERKSFPDWPEGPQSFVRAWEALSSARFRDEFDWVPEFIEIDFYEPPRGVDATCDWPGWRLEKPTDPWFRPSLVGSTAWLLRGVAFNDVERFIARCAGRVRQNGRGVDVYVRASIPSGPRENP